MRIERLLSLAAALGLHAFVLWGWKPEAPAIAVSAGEANSEVLVDLVEAPPAEAAPEPVPEPPVPVEPPPTPEPPPMPEPPPPPPEPVPPPPEPAPMADPIPPPQATPPPRPTPKPQPRSKPRPATSQSATPAAASTNSGAATQAATGGASSGAGRARFKRQVRPEYPAAAKQARLTGTVVVQINVNALGQPTSVMVLRSSGHPALDAAAVQAARRSTFYPRTLAGLPVPDTVKAPFRFNLAD